MRRFFVFILILFASFQLFAQQISVAAFERRDHDLDARVNYPIKDQNGDVCALIKIETTQTGFVFEGGQLGIMKTEQKVGEYWVYIPWGSKRITIKHPQLGVLRDYTFPISIEKATVYLMKLTTGKVTTIVEEPEILSQWVVITSEPSGADVYINDKPAGKTPFSREYNIGKHQYRVEMPMYHSDAGVFTLDANSDKTRIDIKLKPNFGTIKVNSSPETGADVLIDGKPTGEKTPCELKQVSSGKHNITIKKAMFYDAWQEVVVEDNKQANVNINMNPTYGELNINTNPSADIYIDGSKVGSNTYTTRKTSGIYTLEARKDKHTSDTKKIEVKDGETNTITLSPTPQYGILKVNANIPDAEIYIDGIKKGSSPATIRELLVGDYNLEIRLKGYASHTQNITIKQNETTEINPVLKSGKQITITSSPSNADLEIDSKSVGKTPYMGELSFGEHKIKLTNNTKTINENITVSETGKTSWEFNVSEFKDPFEDQMVFVKGGTFTMGCTSEQGSDCFDWEKPSHKVTLSDFYIGKFQVTQAQWRAVMGNNPSYFKDCDNCPVEQVSWNDIQDFLKKLNQLTGKNYRLPTEAEWEYAARGGASAGSATATKYSGSNNIDEVAWYDGKISGKTHPVGQKKANELGLYDMSGNVWEWCSDWYGDYSTSAQTNPKGASSGSSRVLRGGRWSNLARYCRVSYRDYNYPDYRAYSNGFRVVLSP